MTVVILATPKLEDSTPPPSPPPPPPPQSTPTQYQFPTAHSQIIPNPSKFISSDLLSSALPTSSFFTNFVVANGDQPTFIHPYLIKLAPSSLSLSYASISSSSSSISQSFNPDLTISTPQSSRHSVSNFDDLTVTVDFLSSDFCFLLARGSPYITLEVSRPLQLCFSSKSVIRNLSSTTGSKHRIELQNEQTWLLYSSSVLNLKKRDDTNIITKQLYSGVVRIAIVSNIKNTKKNEEILDKYSTCYATSGEAILSAPFKMEYKWEKKGWGDQLLMLAHPLHLKLLSVYNSGIKVLDHFKYKSIDGDLVGVVGNRWSLSVDNVPISWHSKRGILNENYPEIVTALWKDVGDLSSTSIKTTNSYHYALQIARAARLGLIAEEVNCMDVIPAVSEFLRQNVEPWLVGSFKNNGFLYDDKWGGIVFKSGLIDPKADYGSGLYCNHHYTLGYFVFSVAVLAKFDPEWGLKFKGQAYALVASYMSLGRMKKEKSKYAKLRAFDAYKLHSWTNRLDKDSSHHSENPSASINAYYSASLLGRVFGDDHLVNIGSTLASCEIEAVKTWWHVKEDGVYEGDFCRKNRMVGIVWDFKREDKLWFTKAENKECRLGIQVFPLMPVLSDILYSDIDFVRDVVDWAYPSLARLDASDSWKGFVYALEAIYDKKNALKKIRSLKDFHEGNSLSNLLWWVHSRTGKKNFCTWCRKEAIDCWFCNNCC